MEDSKPASTQDRRALLLAAMQAIIDAVKAAGPHGAPGGALYAALMSFGCTLEQFNTIMATLVDLRFLRKEGHLYYHLKDLPNVPTSQAG